MKAASFLPAKVLRTWIPRIILNQVGMIFLAIGLLGILPSEATGQWQKVQNIAYPYSGVFWLDVFFLPADPLLGWIGGANGYTLRTTDGGVTWRGSRVTTLNLAIESIQFVSRDVGFCSATHSSLSSSTDPLSVFKSTDGGVTWSDTTPWPEPDNLWGLYFLNELEGVIIGGGCSEDQSFYYTSNGGWTWSKTTASTYNSGLTDPILLPSGSGYASSSGYIWRTTNSGRNWNIMCSTGPTNDWQEEITLSGSSILVPYAESCTGSGSGGGMLFTGDLGQSWRKLEVGYNMFGAFLLDPNTGWACGENASVYYTSNTGTSWSDVNDGITATDDLDDMWFTAPDRGFVVGSSVYRLCLDDPAITSDKGFTLQPGEEITLDAGQGYDTYSWSTGANTRTITVRSGGTYYVSVSYNYGCTGYDEVQIHDQSASTTIRIPDLAADPHDKNFHIPVLLESADRLSLADPTLLKTVISFNPTLFAPRNVSNGTWTDIGIVNGMRRIELQIPLSGMSLMGTGEVLTEIEGAVLLGNSASTPLGFVPAQTQWSTSTGMDVQTTTEDGSLTLDASSLCGQGGTRLLAYPFGMEKASIAGERGRLSITATVMPGQSIIVEIHSLIGIRVFQQTWVPLEESTSDTPQIVEGNWTLPAPLMSGMYFVSIRSAQHLDVSPVPAF